LVAAISKQLSVACTTSICPSSASDLFGNEKAAESYIVETALDTSRPKCVKMTHTYSLHSYTTITACVPISDLGLCLRSFKVMSTIASHSPFRISETVRDRGLVSKEMVCGKSNGHVTHDVT